jgi:uncharacterized protein YciI
VIVAVLYEYDGDAALMDEVRPAHREFLFSHPGILLSGPTDAGGAVIVFEADPVELEAWLDEDPFRKAGVIGRRTITPWTIVGGAWKDQLGL